MKSMLIFCLIIGISLGAPVEGPGKINDLPTLDPYQPEKPPVVPIKLGHRRKFDYKQFLGKVLNMAFGTYKMFGVKFLPFCLFLGAPKRL